MKCLQKHFSFSSVNASCLPTLLYLLSFTFRGKSPPILPTAILQLPLSPLSVIFCCLGLRMAFLAFPSMLCGMWLSSGWPSLEFRMWGYFAFGSQSPFWDKREKFIWRAGMSLCEASTFILPAQFAFCLSREYSPHPV